MDNRRERERDLIVIATAEEYAYKHNLEAKDVLQLFQKKGIFDHSRSQYEVLHTQDLSESTEFVESYFKRNAI